MPRFLTFAGILFLFSACSYSQQEAEKPTPDYSDWVELTKGMEYREIDVIS